MITCDQIGRLMVRRQSADESNHDHGFLWPRECGVTVRLRPREIFNDRADQCGAGLYGYSCDPRYADAQCYQWDGGQWRLIIGHSTPVICNDGKAKVASATVLYMSADPYQLARIVHLLGGTIPGALARTVCYDLDAIHAPLDEGDARDRMLVQVTIPKILDAIAYATATPEEWARREADAARERTIREGLARIGRAIAYGASDEGRAARAWITSGLIAPDDTRAAQVNAYRIGAPGEDARALIGGGWGIPDGQGARDHALAWARAGFTEADQRTAHASGITDPGDWHAICHLDGWARYSAIVRALCRWALATERDRIVRQIVTHERARARREAGSDRSPAQAIQAWREADGYAVRAVAITGAIPGAATSAHAGRAHLNAIAVYTDRVGLTRPAWITPDALAIFMRRSDRAGPLIQWDRRAEGRIVARSVLAQGTRAGRDQRALRAREDDLRDAALSVPGGTVKLRTRYESRGWGRSRGDRAYIVIQVTLTDGRTDSTEIERDQWDREPWAVRASTVRTVHARCMAQPSAARIQVAARRAQKGGDKRPRE